MQRAWSGAAIDSLNIMIRSYIALDRASYFDGQNDRINASLLSCDPTVVGATIKQFTHQGVKTGSA
eukprot:1074359-Karenia_brevis.AAC.1